MGRNSGGGSRSRGGRGRTRTKRNAGRALLRRGRRGLRSTVRVARRAARAAARAARRPEVQAAALGLGIAATQAFASYQMGRTTDRLMRNTQLRRNRQTGRGIVNLGRDSYSVN
jgi:hypothetical protein